MNDLTAMVRGIVAKHAPAAALEDDTPLGGDGIGLDSIAIAEVLIDCESRFGVEIADLLGGEPVTIRRIVQRLGAAAAP